MTRNEAYKELKGYRADVARCESISWHIKELRSRMYTLKISTSDSEAVQGGGAKENVERIIDELDRLCESYGRTLLSSEEKRRVIERKVEALEHPYGEVLRRKYLDGQSYERIAVDMSRRYRRNYTYEAVRQIQVRAVDRYCKT